MLAVRAREAGGPEVLEVVDLPVPVPAPGRILVRHQAIGLNFIDTYQRSGLYPTRFPAVLGQEAAGTVEAVGEGVPIRRRRPSSPADPLRLHRRHSGARRQRRAFFAMIASGKIRIEIGPDLSAG